MPTAPAGRRPACPTPATARRRVTRAPARASSADAGPGAATTAARPPATSSAAGCRAANRGRRSSASSATSRRSASPTTRLPKRSATSRWTVSPRVGSPVAEGEAAGSVAAPRQPAETGSQLAARLVADQETPLVGIARGEQRLERHVGVAVAARRDRRTRASPPRRARARARPRRASRRRSPRAGAAVATRPALGPTGPSCRR